MTVSMSTHHSSILLEKQLFSFFQQHWKPDRPILLGFSGGPDSFALLHLMLKFREKQLQKERFIFHVAHVDHGWRQESAEEAEQIKKLVKELGLSFHMMKIPPEKLQKGNLEALSRQERFSFFLTLHQTFSYQALILGHHADDQAETVLKEVLEGRGLPFLEGIKSFSYFETLPLWRPLLTVRKRMICQWLQEHSLKPLVNDHTNLDPKFLRGRMRTKILPHLSKEFGKEIEGSLCRLAEEAHELHAYLQERLRDSIQKIQKGKLGLSLDLSDNGSLSLFEWKFLVHRFCEEARISPSKELISKASDLLNSQSANKQLEIGKRIIYLDRGRLFATWSENTLPSLLLAKLTNESLVPRVSFFGPWEISVEFLTNSRKIEENSDWRQVWAGEQLQVILPRGDYQIGAPLVNAKYQVGPGDLRCLGKWWTNHRVPAFLRQCAPVLWQNGVVVHEFLSGVNPWQRHEAGAGGVNQAVLVRVSTY